MLEEFGDDFGPCFPCSTSLGMVLLFPPILIFAHIIFIFFYFKLAFENATMLL